MIATWIAVAAVGVASIALKGAGPVGFAGRPLPRAISLVMPLLAPCLLAALVVGQTVADGRALVIDARLAGVAAAAVALRCGRRCSSCSPLRPASPPRRARSAPPIHGVARAPGLAPARASRCAGTPS